MGSRVMHYIIAKKLASLLPLSDKSAFCIGGVAVDAGQPKDKAHYYRGAYEDYTRIIDYEGFIKKKLCNQHKDYFLGYYAHLIADDLWLNGFYMPWLRNRINDDPSMASLYHQDFVTLNPLLVKHYGLSADDICDRMEEMTLPDLPFVPGTTAKQFMKEIKKDMEILEHQGVNSLNVFTFGQIIGYIETSIDKAHGLIKPYL
ncbi:hydrolase [Bacillus sp. 1P06AnD]|uniref:hydrolase n=1 Tax=Bacillus sp. 1P06AnD TaxID=3132208 RepID=UPI0039A24842